MTAPARFWQIGYYVVLLALVSSLFGTPARALDSTSSDPNQQDLRLTAGGSVVKYSARNDVSPPLREIQPRLPETEKLQAPREIPLYPLPDRESAAQASPGVRHDPVLQDKPGTRKMPAVQFNVEGLDNNDNATTLGFLVSPPDTAGAIGPNHYVQWVNLVFAIWEIDRGASTATLVYGPAAGNTLWEGFGGICETNNDGDIIVLYDEMANRWFMSQFALFGSDGFHQCVAVSATDDPTGSWYRYDFLASETKINDYPKFGIWPDAYYMSANQFDSFTFDWAGQGVWALERDQMLLGLPARMVYFDLFDANPNLGGMLPADLDGLTLPPAGTAQFFVQFDDDAYGVVEQDQLQVWAFSVDWTQPGNSTFTHLTDLPTEPFDSSICPTFRGECIEQPNGQFLEDLADRLMYRLQYRNFGDHRTMVVNHSVDVLSSSDQGQAGIRWYELRDNGSGWGIYQQGTYAPDGDHRWMGSIAMDQVGNLAVGYSVSSATTFPSIRYAGRMAGDPLNTLPQAEGEIVTGSFSQEGTARWGDYSMLTIDPTDDCTFWYTQEYVDGQNTERWGNWSTRFASFKFPTCTSGPAGDLQGTVTDSGTNAPLANALIDLGDGIMTFTNADGFYHILNLPAGIYDVTAWALGYRLQTASGVVITDGTPTTQDFALEPAPSVEVNGSVTDDGHGWPLYARIDITTYGFSTSHFTNPVDGTYQVTLFQDTPYTFTVNTVSQGYLEENRPVTPPAGGSTEDFSLVADPLTCSAPGYAFNFNNAYSSDFESDDGGFTVSGSTSWEWGSPTNGPGEAHSGTNVWATNLTGDYADNESGEITSPEIDLSPFAGDNLFVSWWQWLQTESGFDYARVEVSNDGGATWNAIFGPTSGDIDLSWKDYFITLDSSYAVSNFRVRFNLKTDSSVTYPGYYVDDVTVGSAACETLAGGLVVGNVYDANTTSGLTGAVVTNDVGGSAVTIPTPDDPDLEDGFYNLFSPDGVHTLTATKSGGYGADSQDVTVVANSVVVQDFYLPAGLFTLDPPSLEATLDMGQSATAAFTISNQGGLDANFELSERDMGTTPAPRSGAPIRHRSGHFTPHRFGSSTKPLLSEARPIPIDSPPWIDIADYPTAIMDSTVDVFDGLVYSVGGFDGSSILNLGYEYDPSSGSWSQIAALSFSREKPAAAFVEGLLYVTGGWSDIGQPVADLEIYDPATDTWSTGAPVPTPYAAAAAVNLEGQLYVIGGCESFFCGTTDVFRYDPASDSWTNAAPYPEPTSWLACGVIDGLIYCAGGVSDALGESANTYRYDPGADAWSQLADMPQTQWGMGFTAANGLLYISGGVTDNFSTVTNETFFYDPAMDTWSPDANSNNTLYRGASTCGFYKIGGAVSSFDPVPDSELYPGLEDCGGVTDVPWVSETPVSGMIAANGGTQEIDVTFDAGVPEVVQPGAYTAQLKVKTDTPYKPDPIVVTMNVNPPPTWGKVTGVVTGLERCDAPGAPLTRASVEIVGAATVQTDSQGVYIWWLEQGEYALVVSTSGYISQTVDVTVNAGAATVNNFDLRLDAPCASQTPDAFDLTVVAGASAEAALALDNAGAGEATYRVLETDLPQYLPPTPILAPSRPGLFAKPAVMGPASVLSLTGPHEPVGKAPQRPAAGWFGGLDLPGGIVRYAHAQCPEQPDSLYVISGVDGRFSVTPNAWRYDANANTWTELQPIPAGTEAPTAVCYFGKIYVMGGGGSDFFYIYDIGSNTWTTGAPLPRGVAGASAGAWNGKIYLIGGDDDFYPASGVSDEVNIYDISTDTWIGNGAVMPVGTSMAGFVQAGQYVYVVGGWGVDAPGSNVTATMRYNLATDTWGLGPQFTAAKADFALALTDQALYAIAGDSGGGSFFEASDDFLRLGLSAWPAGVWSDTGDPLPIKVSSNTAGFCAEILSAPAVWSIGGGNLNLGLIYGSNLFNFAEGEHCYSIYSDLPWLSEAPAEGSVPADSSVDLAVTFDASNLAPDEYHADLVIATNDSGAFLLRVPVRLTVVETGYGISLTPKTASSVGFPGATITYTLQVKNTGNIADAYQVTIGGNTWLAEADPQIIGPLEPGDPAQLVVRVTIPGNAGNGEFDQATVTVTSQGEPTLSASARLTTISGHHRLFLPLLYR